MAGDRGDNRSPCGQTSGFPGGILGAQTPSLPWGVPTPSLHHHRTPTSCDKWPSASLMLRTLGPGCEALAYVA